MGFDWPAERETRNRDDRASEPPLRNAEWHAIRTAVRSTEAYRSDPGFCCRFDDLDADLRRSPERSTPQAACERILLCAFSALGDADVRPAPNVMALARRALELFLKPNPDNGGSDESTQGADNGSGDTSAPRNEKKYMLPASYLGERAQAPVRRRGRSDLAGGVQLGDFGEIRRRGIATLHKHPGSRPTSPR